MIDKANEIWPLFALMMPFNGAVFALDGILIGAGDTRFLMWGMLAAAAVYIPIALLALHDDWGIVGVWWGLRRADRRSSSHVRRAVRRLTLGVDRRAGLTTLSPAHDATDRPSHHAARPRPGRSGGARSRDAFGPLPQAAPTATADADGDADAVRRRHDRPQHPLRASAAR